MVKIAVIGGFGKMGKELLKAIKNTNDIKVECVVTRNIEKENYFETSDFNICNSIFKVSNEIELYIDFTNANCVYENAKKVISRGKKLIIGASGLKKKEIEILNILCKENKTSVLIVPNFSIGAVLMVEFSKKASQYFKNIEIIEYHHEEKIDSPSGTAIFTANEIKLGVTKNSIKDGRARGELIDNINIHSVRMPGFLASQDVVFGQTGEVLKISHSLVDRKAFMPGVLLAIRSMEKIKGVKNGLKNVL